jgi:hypothetical protein
MKKFSDKLWFYGVVFVLILLTVNGIISMFGGLDKIRIIGGGSLFIGFLKIPFCLWGIVQISRGVIKVINEDSETIKETFVSDKHQGIASILYILITVAGCLMAVDAYNIIK